MIRITVMLPEEHKDILEKIAKEEDRNLSWMVRKAVQEYIEKNRSKE